ncbi:hypothetical protein [Candidatus Methanodesulfokora washburnensis]|uniref:Uncharacterized protein n=1 Tax=Candidatus Methanodesulfokora washburnensis TaxID=2478471 RepID=A0A429GEK8_9CREN|nr:hypothetical protein [Candidatus Methanodesulfokores washburnensis]RSN72278.1 hypothetical protein D6D85_14495 [Candidatus Methanodesulfokores washburnensis]
MRSEDLSRLVGGKCEESSGKFEFWPDIKKATCRLDSTEGLPELIDFIRKIELPDDMEEKVLSVEARFRTKPKEKFESLLSEMR